ncbi:hypothetical protein [Natronospora cellulosivora (SeqCode)]
MNKKLSFLVLFFLILLAFNGRIFACEDHSTCTHISTSVTRVEPDVIEECGQVLILEDPEISIYLPANWQYNITTGTTRRINDIFIEQIFYATGEMEGEHYIVGIAKDRGNKLLELASYGFPPTKTGRIVKNDEVKGKINIYSYEIDESLSYTINTYYLHKNHILEIILSTSEEERIDLLKEIISQTIKNYNSEFEIIMDDLEIIMEDLD